MISQSESIKNLAAALLKAQAELGAITENATNPFFKKSYADLGEHIRTIKPAFQKNGLVITQFVSGSNDEIGVTTMLMHESGEWLKSTAVIQMEQEKGNSKAQTAGKAISYLRRYALAAVANVYSGDDNDGNIEPPKKTETKKQNGQKKAPAQELKELGFEDKDDKYLSLPEYAVKYTDIDNVHHATQWLNKLYESKTTVNKNNVVELREQYNAEKES